MVLCRVKLEFLVFLMALTIPIQSLSQSNDKILKMQGQEYKIISNFTGKKEGKAAVDISGAACMKSPQKKIKKCVAINDENQAAQMFTMQERHLAVGPQVRLIKKDFSDLAIGKKPNIKCPASDNDFKEFDGEGVAYDEPYFYVIGSHGCSRSSGKGRLSSFLLVRFQLNEKAWTTPDNKMVLDSDNDLVMRFQTTFRISDVLHKADAIKPFIGKDLSKDNGVNIEGIAIVDNRLIIGLRAPSIDGNAFLIAVSLNALFISGWEPFRGDVDVIPLPVGKNAGIRDLSPLSSGRLLILTGPSQEQRDVPYSLFVADSKSWGSIKRLPFDIASKENKSKAEGVTVLDDDSKKLKILVLFDGVENGDPHVYDIPLD